MKNRIVLSLFAFSAIAVLSMCNKATDEDKALFSRSATTEGFTWYKGNDAKLESTIPGAHHKYVRTRFNAIAQSALGSDGTLPVGASFPEGSLIVKESYDENDNFKIYAVMEKAPNNSAAGEGWLWAEYDADGKAVHSISKSNTGCINCHNDSGNRDLVMFFDRFP